MVYIEFCQVLFWSCRSTPWHTSTVCVLHIPGKALIGSSGLFLSHKWLARHVCRFVWCSFHSTKDRYRQYKLYRFVKHSFLPAMVSNGVYSLLACRSTPWHIVSCIYPWQSTYRFFKCSQLPSISCISLWSIFSFTYRLHKLYLAPAQTQQGMYSFHKCCLHHTHARQGICVGLSDTVCIPQ